MELSIRSAREEDAAGIGTVRTLSWQAAYKGIIPDGYLTNLSAEKNAERFIANYKSYTETGYYVAELNGEVVGNLTLHKSRDEDKPLAGEIGAIYLHPAYWSRGFGKRMMDYAVDILAGKGYKEIFLWVLKDNSRARMFYEKYGYVSDGTEKEIIIGKPLVEIRYIKEIPHNSKDLNQMENQLKLIADSYDRGVECGKKGIDLYKELPEHITSHPDYLIYQEITAKTGVTSYSGDSGHSGIRDYLSPNDNMKFVDLGCCLNLMINGYDKWPSIYHGVDISGKNIELLYEFVSKNSIPVGSLHCGSIHETPYESDYFDIGACIGVLEYFKKDFVKKAIVEANRIIKPRGKFVLDIPNIASPACRGMMLVEEHIGRPDLFDMLPWEFENMVCEYFDIEKAEKDDTWPMFRYFLSCKK